ncbi:uncharacterized protein LOC130949704 [Arachis stenosperma]|uniref:uncharacterized protein LOC130949704 n=1 Tax=Arachis stenosperma TaxID=217475 RepID=UPI0025AD5BC6|nr:uncharacterized protein LOC130949704 [Arachis stenosperma]
MSKPSFENLCVEVDWDFAMVVEELDMCPRNVLRRSTGILPRANNKVVCSLQQRGIPLDPTVWELGNDPITWGAFQVEFYKKYFPNSARTVKELELLQLKQGTMSVSEYTDKFEELFRFSRMCQGTPGDSEEWKCIKYEGGLRECVRKAVEAKNDHWEFHRREHNQDYPTRGQEFKRRGYPQRFPQRRNDLATNKNSQGKGREKQIVAASDVLSCQKCGGHHPNRPCRYGSGLCYNCRKLGHLVRDCPHRKDRETARSDFRT